MNVGTTRRRALRCAVLPTVAATAISGLVVIATAPAAAAAPARNGDPGSYRQVVQTKAVEVPSLATKTSKTYRQPNGTMRTVIHATTTTAPPKGAVTANSTPVYSGSSPTCGIDSAVVTANCSATTTKAGFATTAKRTLMQFDLSAIYRNAVVTNASLAIDVTARVNATADSLTAYPVTTAWNTSATWTKATGSTNWTTAGGDASSTAAFSIANAASVGYKYNPMTKATADWVSGAVTNNGLLLKANEAITNTLTIASGNDPTNGPTLTVDYDYDTSQRASSSYFNQTLDDTTGLSVNLSNGDLRIAANDLHVPGVGQDLDVVRSWSSLRKANSRELGNAWQLDNTEAHVDSQNDGALVTLPGGTAGKFLYNGSGYTTPMGWNADLTRLTSSWVLKFHRTGVTWTFNDVAGATYEATLNTTADRNGNTITYGYSASATVGDNSWPVLSTITDTFGAVTTVTSNATTHLITKITDASGRHADYTITSGKLTAAADLLAETTTYSYDANGYVSRISTPLGHDTKITYGADGRAATVTRVTNVGADTGPTWTFTYNSYAGSPLLGTTVVNDPNNHNTTYTRDTQNRITHTVDPLGKTHDKAWTPNSDAASITDGLSNVQNFTYNATTSNMTKMQSSTETDTYGSVAGYATSFDYTDPSHPYQSTRTTTPAGNHIASAYNTAGNVISSTNDNTTQNQYSKTYNSDGTVATSTDTKSNVTTYGYTGHRLTSIDNPAPLGDESFTYDSVGRIRTHVDGNAQTTTYTFNAQNRLTSIAFNSSGTVTFTYDTDGNLTNRTDASGSYVFKFDRMERAYEKDFPTTGSSSVIYDGASNATSYTDANGTITYGYDAANNVTSLAEPGGSCTGTVSLCTTFGYDNNNARNSTTYPNGIIATTTYDNAGRPLQIKYLGSATGATFTYVYRSATNTDQELIQMSQGPSLDRSYYTYDKLDRLTDDTVKDLTSTINDEWSYTYDGNSNKTGEARLGLGSNTFTYNAADELATDAFSHTWTYDANGNLYYGNNGFSASYNDRDQSTSITQVGGATTSQGYADFGQHERTSSGSTSFLNGLLGLQSETTGGVSTTYVRDPSGGLIDMKRGSTRYYYETDALGSVRGLTDSSGNLVQSFNYDPYGQVLTTSITVDSAYKWAGGYYDTATKMYHFGDRYYDPNLARWSQRDTSDGSLATPSGMNKFAYANGDPINSTDPTGHSGTISCQALFGGLCNDTGDLSERLVGGCVGATSLSGLRNLSVTAVEEGIKKLSVKAIGGPETLAATCATGAAGVDLNPFHYDLNPLHLL